MNNYIIKLNLLRDTTFGRGDGVAGLLDVEVEHDEYGLPFLRGRALKGMLVYECADILFALRMQKKAMLPTQEEAMEPWYEAACFLFGKPESHFRDNAQLRIDHARLPDDLKQAIAYQMALSEDQQSKGTLRQTVLNGLTTIRRQTAVDRNGAAKEHSLRASRLILRQTEFESKLWFSTPLEDLEKPETRPAHINVDSNKVKGLLAACIKSLHRVGTRRHRGPGLLVADLFERDDNNPSKPLETSITTAWFNLFKQEVSVQ